MKVKLARALFFILLGYTLCDICIKLNEKMNPKPHPLKVSLDFARDMKNGVWGNTGTIQVRIEDATAHTITQTNFYFVYVQQGN